jgi:hypothetical protein
VIGGLIVIELAFAIANFWAFGLNGSALNLVAGIVCAGVCFLTLIIGSEL